MVPVAFNTPPKSTFKISPRHRRPQARQRGKQVTDGRPLKPTYDPQWAGMQGHWQPWKDLHQSNGYI